MITENVSTLEIHKLTQKQYDRLVAAGTVNENAIYLTPDDGSDRTGLPVVIEETNPAILTDSGVVLDTVMTPSEARDAVKSGLSLNITVAADDASIVYTYHCSYLVHNENGNELFLVFSLTESDVVFEYYPSATIKQIVVSVGADGTMTTYGQTEVAVQRPLSRTEIADMIYPVGSIYISVTATNPSTLFGGTWTRIQDRFLLAAGSSYTAGSTGGEATHTLTVDEMPSHQHTADFWSSKAGNAGYEGSCATNYDCWNRPTERATSPVQATGGGQAHNNMPPYLAVYMWQRTA